MSEITFLQAEARGFTVTLRPPIGRLSEVMLAASVTPFGTSAPSSNQFGYRPPQTPMDNPVHPPASQEQPQDDMDRRDFLKASAGLIGALPLTTTGAINSSSSKAAPSRAGDDPLPPGAKIVRGPAKLSLPVRFSVFAGCYNLWGRNEYWRYAPFRIDLEKVASASTCGSPVFSSGPWWVGFLCDAPGLAESDGKQVVFSIPEGQELLVFEHEPHNDSPWELYTKLATQRLREPPAPHQPAAHAYDWEFCTWVEQKRVSRPGQHPRTVLNDGFVRSLAERVLKLGIEPGKFTIDDGWQELSAPHLWTDGYWRPNRAAFPDLAKTCAWLRSEGFVPGLWFGMGWYPKSAAVRTERPGVFGQWEVAENAETQGDGSPWSLAANAETEAYLRETLLPYAQMGFRKFKFDFFYGERGRANAFMRTLYRAVRSIDPTIEIESHHPDFFFSRWCDTVRLNDVLVQPGRDWESLTLAHMRVTRLCAPDRIMNLDHLGGNDPLVGESDYLRHLELLDTAPPHLARYAVLSLLPDHYSVAAAQKVVEFISRHRRPLP